MTEKYDKFKDINVFVYCGGKTGSSTLYKTFKKLGFNVMHVHSNAEFQKVTAKSNELNLYELIDYVSKNNQQIYIIDSYRTPIERSISGFFENINSLILDSPNNYSTSDLIDYYIKNNCHIKENYFPLCEMHNRMGLPLPESFDFQNEFIEINFKKNIKIISLRFSGINKWETILSNIFNKKITLVNDNISKDKWYYQKYMEFLENYKPSLEHIKQIKVCPFFKIYNTPDEQNEYFKKWGIDL